MSVDPLSRMRTLSITELRSRLTEVLRSIRANQECILLERRSKPAAVLVPYEKYLELVAGSGDRSALESLTKSYAQAAESMNTPEARAAAKKAFDAGAEEYRDIGIH